MQSARRCLLARCRRRRRVPFDFSVRWRPRVRAMSGAYCARSCSLHDSPIVLCSCRTLTSNGDEMSRSKVCLAVCLYNSTAILERMRFFAQVQASVFRVEKRPLSTHSRSFYSNCPFPRTIDSFESAVIFDRHYFLRLACSSHHHLIGIAAAKLTYALTRASTSTTPQSQSPFLA